MDTFASGSSDFTLFVMVLVDEDDSDDGDDNEVAAGDDDDVDDDDDSEDDDDEDDVDDDAAVVAALWPGSLLSADRGVPGTEATLPSTFAGLLPAEERGREVGADINTSASCAFVISKALFSALRSTS